MSAARFLLSAGVAGDGRLRSWVPTGLLGVPQPQVQGIWYAWRLLGGNNRELGRSARLFGSERDVTLDVAALRRHEPFERHVMRSSRSGDWTWFLRDHDSVVALSGRAFHREVECLHSLELFIAAIDTAVVAGAAVLVRSRPGGTWDPVDSAASGFGATGEVSHA